MFPKKTNKWFVLSSSTQLMTHISKQEIIDLECHHDETFFIKDTFMMFYAVSKYIDK